MQWNKKTGALVSDTWGRHPMLDLQYLLDHFLLERKVYLYIAQAVFF